MKPLAAALLLLTACSADGLDVAQSGDPIILETRTTYPDHVPMRINEGVEAVLTTTTTQPTSRAGRVASAPHSHHRVNAAAGPLLPAYEHGTGCDDACRAANRDLGRQMVHAAGYGEADFVCIDAIVQRESRWDHLIWNGKGSGAYGIPQSLPASKMATAGADWRTNPATQIRWMLDLYIVPRYGSPCGAWAFKRANGWY